MRLSLRSKILGALLIVIFLMCIPYLVLIIPGLQYKQQYDAIIENITAANRMKGQVKQSIDAEIWSIITEQKTFAEGQQYIILDDVAIRIQAMTNNTESPQGRLKLDVIRRTLQTLHTD